MTEPLVSAIVPTYASERFIAGSLDDLEAQTDGRRTRSRGDSAAACIHMVVTRPTPERALELLRRVRRLLR